MTKRTLLPVLAAALAGFPACGASAADIGSPAPVPRAVEAAPAWVLQVTPYTWATGIHGRISPFRRTPTIGIDKSFGDVLEDLNIGGFVNVWARHGRFVFSGDAMYVDTTASKAIGALPGIGPIPTLGAKVDTTEFTGTLQAGYRLLATPQFTFDLLAGFRVWDVSNKLTVRFGPFGLSHTESFAFVDPVIGGRAFYRLTDALSVQAQGDVGGFGIGSDITWQAMATVNYVLSDSLSASAGYKLLRTRYKSGGHVFDTTLSGPVLGITYRF